jgi:uncharacterized membrane protein
MIRFASLLLWLAALPLQAEVFPALHEVVGVAADDVLNIREAPSATAPIIGALPPDATGVEVVAIEGSWAVLNAGEGSGYAALRYLARETGPDWNALQTPLTCLGTEPFWSLQIDPPAGETRFQTPEDEAAQIAPISASWPALPWAQSAAVALPDGLAVLTPAECSDGMSDQSYGIAADLFLTGTDRMRLSGCCRIGQP